MVDDFLIKYTGKEHAQHLLAALKEDYQVSMDWEAQLFCGITLEWDYNAHTITLSMPGYVQAALQRFQHPSPVKPEDAPYKHNPPNYGAKIQLTPHT